MHIYVIVLWVVIGVIFETNISHGIVETDVFSLGPHVDISSIANTKNTRAFGNLFGGTQRKINTSKVQQNYLCIHHVYIYIYIYIYTCIYIYRQQNT